MRGVAGHAREIARIFFAKRDTCVAKVDAGSLEAGQFAVQDARGTTVAKESAMLTLSAFVIAMGSVCMSVFWACKEDTTDHV